MKLYTEEQVKKQKEVLEDVIDLWDEGLPLDSHTIEKCKNILLELTPIQLPSDEEILQQFENYSENWEIRHALQFGAKSLRDKIQGGNK